MALVMTGSAPALAQEAFVRGQYLVKYANAPAGVAARDVVHSRHQSRTLRQLPLIGAELIETQSQTALEEHTEIKELLSSGAIKYIEPNYHVHTFAEANDPRFGDLWGLHSSTGDNDIDAPEAWDTIQNAQDVVVAVVDTGVDYTHPDLEANIWFNEAEIPNNGLDDDGNGVVDDVHGFNAHADSGDPFDDNGHGTHVAGTIGAHGNNAEGVTGVAWRVRIMPVKFLSASGGGSIDKAVAAIDYVVQAKESGVPVRVINCSWGGSGESQALKEAIERARLADILVVGAAGNAARDNDMSPSYPASYDLDNVIAVAATDEDGNLASFSNYGASSVDVAAPGQSILSTYPGNDYRSLSGTSMAAPHVSGVLALLAQRFPELSSEQLRNRITATVKYRSSLHSLLRFPGVVSAHRSLENEITALPTPSPSQSYSMHSATYGFNEDLGERVTSEDDAYVRIALPFSFPFYGEQHDQLAISTNGRVIPLTASQSTPSEADYNNILRAGVLAYHDDLYPATKHTDASGVWVAASDTEVRITWIAIPYSLRLSNNPATVVEVQLHINSQGHISIHYKDTATGFSSVDAGGSATVGIAPSADVSGVRLLVSHNQNNAALLGNGKAIRIRTQRPAVADFDGDGRSDIVVWRPNLGRWFVLPSSQNFAFEHHYSVQYGLPGDIPVPADVDGDGKSDFGVYRPQHGMWYYLLSSSDYTESLVRQWGLPNDTPRVGDFDNDGRADLAVFRPSTGQMYILTSSSGFNRLDALSGAQQAAKILSVGPSNRAVLPADFDGDGSDEVATLTDIQNVTFWTLHTSDNQFISSSPWGVASDFHRACDIDGDGAADRVAVRQMPAGNYEWYVVTATGQGISYSFGSLMDYPRCDRDYDGDGKGDLAVFRPGSAQWFVRNSSDGSVISRQFGLLGDYSF